VGGAQFQAVDTLKELKVAFLNASDRDLTLD
jgi:hypothetical protein